jgi:hypothetical protein
LNGARTSRRSRYFERAPDVPIRGRGIGHIAVDAVCVHDFVTVRAATVYSPIFDGPVAATMRLATRLGIASDYFVRRVTIATPVLETPDFMGGLTTSQS